MRNRGPLFFAQLAFTLLVSAFLIVPVVLSMLAGLTVNYLVGIHSGLTLRWVGEVWVGYRDTIFLSIGIALACLGCTLVLVLQRWRYVLAVFAVMFGFILVAAYKAGHRYALAAKAEGGIPPAPTEASDTAPPRERAEGENANQPPSA